MAVKGQAFSEVKPVAPQQVFISNLADMFKSQMDDFFRKNLGDDAIMKEWHRSFYLMMEKGIEYPPVKKWLRPSMVGADEQAIWLQLNGYKSDQVLLDEPQDEVHTRWQAIGTVVGDMWQRQILAAEYWTKKGKADVDFRFERKYIDVGDAMTKREMPFPYFEEFAREYHEIEGVPVWGTCDGIINWIPQDKNGVKLPAMKERIGFEVKSKQTTNASTGTYKMKTAEEKHIQQIKTYALMYDLDYYFILYQNCSKKGWTQDEETKSKYPDVRVFGVYISQEEKNAHIEYLKSLWDLRNSETKPPLNPLKWTFNSHKISAIVNMTDEEYLELQKKVEHIGYHKAYTKFEQDGAWKCLYEVGQAREEMGK